MGLEYMKIMLEFIIYEYFSMVRASSSDREPPIASTATLPMPGATVVWTTCNMICRQRFSCNAHAVDVS
jgi:hypothetical protein